LENEQGYLSIAGNRTRLGHMVNVDAVRLTITRVYDNSLVSWRNANSRYGWNETESFSHPLAQRTIKILAAKNAVKDLRLSLDELLPAGVGDGVFRMTLSPIRTGPMESADDDTEESDNGASAVVTLSDIGLTAKRTREGVVVWATSLRTANPLAGVRMRVFSSKSQPLGDGITDADGLAEVSSIQPAKDETVAVILADQLPPARAGTGRPQHPTGERPEAWVNVAGSARQQVGPGRQRYRWTGLSPSRIRRALLHRSWSLFEPANGGRLDTTIGCGGNGNEQPTVREADGESPFGRSRAHCQ
jgi:hypothetical protein